MTVNDGCGRATHARSFHDESRYETVIMKGFRPWHDRVFIRRIEAEERWPGGTIIPDTAKEKPVEGEVLAFGAVARDDGPGRAVRVKVGDSVLFGKWSGTEVIIGGEERLVAIRTPS
jgi:chaperonin GroES